MLDGLYTIFNICRLNKGFSVAGRLRTKNFHQLAAVVRKAINLGAVASIQNENFVETLQSSQFQNVGVLLVADSEFTAHRGIRLFVVDAGDKKIRYAFKV